MIRRFIAAVPKNPRCAICAMTNPQVLGPLLFSLDGQMKPPERAARFLQAIGWGGTPAQLRRTVTTHQRHVGRYLSAPYELAPAKAVVELMPGGAPIVVKTEGEAWGDPDEPVSHERILELLTIADAIIRKQLHLDQIEGASFSLKYACDKLERAAGEVEEIAVTELRRHRERTEARESA